jgi:hypothetical protein
LLQLLESEDKKLIEKIQRATDVTRMVRAIAERVLDSDDEEGEEKEGEMEVISLARRCVELLGKTGDFKSVPKIVEGNSFDERLSNRDESRPADGRLMEG